tara:strand:+ start:653 stop:1399 length:747 start_codon:yes stop_codon:yes gene_type:complete
MKESMYWTDDRKELAKAFAIAPAIPIFIASVLSLQAGFFVFILGIPVAYGCAMFIGIPLFALYKKADITGWSYYVLGGALCAVPGVLLFVKYNAPIVYSLQSISAFTLIGAIGGIIFWWLYPRKKLEVSEQSNLTGVILILIIGCGLSYIYVLGQYDYIEGKTLSIDHPFVSSEDTVAKIVIAEKIIDARIPKGVPYRSNCKVGVVVWRELFRHKKVYSLSNYPDSPQAYHYQWLTKEAQSNINKSCS